MLYAFGFGRVAVVLSDLYFVDPDPLPGQESPERGVRLEVRLLQAGEVPGSIYAARPITIGTPVWRADLLEQADGPPGSFDRTHHHPAFHGWEPGDRVFDTAMSTDPAAFVGARLRDLPGLLAGAELPANAADLGDAEELNNAVPEIIDVLCRLLSRVHAGELALAPDDAMRATSVRASWL